MMTNELIELRYDETGVPVGVFIPFRHWEVLRDTVKAYSPIFELMDKHARPDFLHTIEKLYGPVNYLEMQMNTEISFIKNFARGEAVYVENSRCPGNPHFVRHNPDGSEDLIFRDWEQEQDVLVQQLCTTGQGVYAYLLKDPRYENYKARHLRQHKKDGKAGKVAAG